MRRALACALAPLALLACAPEPAARDDLFSRLQSLCGAAFQGSVVSDDPRDADWAGETLTVHVRECDAATVRIPLHVGEDRSRTWVVTRLEDGRLRLKHDHRHEDGSEDVLTQYGGETEAPVTGLAARFPADAESRALFEREAIAASMDNVWTLALDPQAQTLTYALDRPDRHFEARFDLARPVEAPPPPWGAR